MSNYVLIPCAGGGSRFGGLVPKQYTKIGSKTIIEHTIDVFLKAPEITQILVVVAKDDDQIDQLPAREFCVGERFTRRCEF